MTSTRRAKRFLSPEQKYDLWVRMLTGQINQADAAAEAGVDREAPQTTDAPQNPILAEPTLRPARRAMIPCAISWGTAPTTSERPKPAASAGYAPPATTPPTTIATIRVG
jgi:hypothetical protein